MDPYEFRMINGLDLGKQTPTGQIIDYSCGLKECLEAVNEAFKEDGLPEPSGPNKKVGYGLASAFKNQGYGTGMEDGAGTRITLQEDGTFIMHTGAVELGQGVDTIICQVAAQTLGVNYDDVNIGPVDDDVSPYSKGSTSAYRPTYGYGNSSRTVSLLMKEEILNYVGEKKEQNPSLLDMNAEGVFHLKDNSFKMTFKEIADLAKENNDLLQKDYYWIDKIVQPLKDDGNNLTNDQEQKVYTTYIFSAQIAVVEVDELTGEVEVLKFYAANDLGKAINPALVEGQIVGGVVMGMGYCLGENFEQEDGYLVRKNFKFLNVPTIDQMPEIESFVIEENHPLGPFGAKGFSEGALNPAAPAILNAIYNAVGIRVDSLPVDTVKLAEAIKNK